MQEPFVGIHNFRAVGPYPLRGGRTLRSGALYRSGALERMTAADRSRLDDAIGIRLVLDLRHPDELVKVDGALSPAAQRAHVSIFPVESTFAELVRDLNGQTGPAPSAARYLRYLEVGGHRFGEAANLIATRGNQPVLIHCTAGKDRTGVLVALLMDLVGASDEDIGHEYGLSDASIDALIDFLEATGQRPQGTVDEIRERLRTPPERMVEFLGLMRRQYGSSADFLLSHGVGTTTLEVLESALTSEG